jgi:acyl dehydratase
VTTTAGSSLPSLTITAVRADDIKVVALILRDPNPIHFDLDAIAAAGLGDRPVNQGGSTMAYVMNMLATWAGSRSAIRRINCSFRGIVFAGDDVQVGGTITAIRESDNGLLAECEVWADVVGGSRAITGTASVLLNPDRS